jgi:hypothetical protein
VRLTNINLFGLVRLLDVLFSDEVKNDMLVFGEVKK